MHIKRLNEMNKNDRDLIESIDSSTDYGILEWIASVSEKSKYNEIKKYTSLYGITDGDMKNNNFLEEKNLKKTEIFLRISEEIHKKEEEIELLEEKSKKKYWDAAYEVLYNFQEDLIHYDFDLLLDLFFDEDEDEPNSFGEFNEILPEIREKYKDIIEAKMESRKFNF